MKKDKLPSLTWIKKLMTKVAKENGIPGQVKDTWRHSTVVWRFADKIAKLAIKNGYRVDRKLLKIAAYSHDLGRMVTGSRASMILKDAVYHGYEGYRILKQLGYPKLAEFCRRHLGGSGLSWQINKKYGLGSNNTFAKTLEEKILAYADARTFFVKRKGPEIRPFKIAYNRFKVYPYGAGRRLKENHKLIKKITAGKIK